MYGTDSLDPLTMQNAWKDLMSRLCLAMKLMTRTQFYLWNVCTGLGFPVVNIRIKNTQSPRSYVNSQTIFSVHPCSHKSNKSLIQAQTLCREKITARTWEFPGLFHPLDADTNISVRPISLTSIKSFLVPFDDEVWSNVGISTLDIFSEVECDEEIGAYWGANNGASWRTLKVKSNTGPPSSNLGGSLSGSGTATAAEAIA